MTEPFQTAVSAASSLSGTTKIDARNAGITTQLLLPFGTCALLGTVLAALHLLVFAEMLFGGAGLCLAAYLGAYFVQLVRDPASLHPPQVIIENKRSETMRYSIDAVARDPSTLRAIEAVVRRQLPDSDQESR